MVLSRQVAMDGSALISEPKIRLPIRRVSHNRAAFRPAGRAPERVFPAAVPERESEHARQMIDASRPHWTQAPE